MKATKVRRSDRQAIPHFLASGMAHVDRAMALHPTGHKGLISALGNSVHAKVPTPSVETFLYLCYHDRLSNLIELE